MSQWRRIAPIEIPGCKRIIEESDSPAQMWIMLSYELDTMSPPTEATIQQIYRLALHCHRTHKPEYLAAQVWLFFHNVVGAYLGGNEWNREDLPKRISTDIFHYWAKALKEDWPAERYVEAIKQFTAAQHRPK